jgi:hypothetical protein
MSSSPWEEASGEGDENVATPFHALALALATGDWELRAVTSWMKVVDAGAAT